MLDRETDRADNEVWTPDDAADYLRLSRRTILNMALRNELPGALVAGKWRFQKEDVVAFFASQRNKAPTQTE